MEPISGINQINVGSAEEMFSAVLDNLPTDVAVFSAAVSDFKIKNKEKYKMKKKENMDLNLENYANEKLNEKNCDWIIANDVSNKKIGFDSDFNEVSIFYKNMKYEKIPKMKKSLLADNIVKKVISHLN